MGAIWAIVVAGGSGRRFGALKQFELHNGRRLVDWSLDTARAVADGVVAVVPADFEDDLGADVVVAGGPTRSASVRNGLSVVPGDTEIVIVHDAARPGASADVFRAVVDAVRSGADAAIPGLPVADTLKRIDPEGGAGLPTVAATIDRDQVVAVQTPQAFAAERLRAAHAAGDDATDDAGLVEAMGGVVAVVPGEAAALKVTAPTDMAVLAALADLSDTRPGEGA